jgi:Radical SAM superfamily/4Fe-4S single cluster domain
MTDRHYCAAPFRHLALQCSNSAYRPCCAWITTGNEPIPDHHPDPLNHPWMETLRQRMLADEYNPGCIMCYQNEESKGWSMRTDFNQIGRVNDVKLTYLEMNFGNLCNLKCRMCGSWGSSRWIADEIKLGQHPHPMVRRTLDNIHIDFAKLDKIKLIGGEPSLEQDAIRQLLGDIRRKRGSLQHLEVEVITNGVVPFDDDIIQLLTECRLVFMQVSMDGIGSWNDYQRTGSVWADIAATARRYHELTSTAWQMAITSCTGIFTIGGMTQLIDWVIANLPLAMHIVRPLVEPRWQAIRNLPTAYEESIRNDLINWKPVVRAAAQSWLPYGIIDAESMRKSLLWHLGQPSNTSIADIRTQVNQLDQLRDESLKQENPELYTHLFG